MNRRPVYCSQVYGNSNSEPDENPPVYEKPSMSYANLIAEAIIQSPEKALVLSDIYEAINAKYPYYDLESQGWQNSIRHNLSLNKNFTKEKKDKTGLKRGWYWKLSEGHSFFAPKKKAFQCDECNKAFSSIGGLNYHKNIVHEENIFHEGKKFYQKFKKIEDSHEEISEKCEDLHEPLTDKSVLENTLELQKSDDLNGSISEKPILENTIVGNPWLVENVQAFSFLNCPECTFKVKEEDLFQDHAVKHHSLSSVLFGANSITECVYIKTEPNEDLTEYNMIESENNEDEMIESELNEDIIEHHMVETELNENISDPHMIKTEPTEDITEEHHIKTELIEDTAEDHIIDLLDNVVVEMDETHEELTYQNFEEKASNSKKRTIGENDINLKTPSKKRKDNSNFEPNEDIGYDKPNLSFAQLIAEALISAPEQSLALSDIYKAINAKHPYYKLETKGWQNSIRHNLSMNENFIKEQNNTDKQGCFKVMRGCYWKLAKDVPISLLETKQKLRRKKRSAKAIQGNLLKGIDNFLGAALKGVRLLWTPSPNT